MSLCFFSSNSCKKGRHWSSSLPFPPLPPSPPPRLRPPIAAAQPPATGWVLLPPGESGSRCAGVDRAGARLAQLAAKMNARQTAPVNQVVGAVGTPPPQSQTRDAAGLPAWVDPQFAMLRNTTRDKIFDYIERKPSSAAWRRRLPELARRLEEILYREYPSKMEYYYMMNGRIEPHLQFAIKQLSAQNQNKLYQRNLPSSRQIASSPGYGTMILTPGITQGTSENSRMSYVTGNIGPSSSGADMVPLNANMGTLLPGEAPGEHVNTLLPLGMNPTHHDRPRASNNNLMIDTVDTPATNMLLKSHAPLKEVRKEPKFSCPVCMNELVGASSTICGHIFCQKCIQASIQAQSKCPTCRRTLTMNCFHRVYLPTMD